MQTAVMTLFDTRMLSAELCATAAVAVLGVILITRWPLDYAADTSFGGQLPRLSVPSFSQPQPYPLVLMQQATPAQGGGWMVHVFLDAAEAPAMQQALEAQHGV